MVKDVLALKAKEALVSLVSEMDKRLLEYWDKEIAKNFGFGKEQKRLVWEILEHAKEHNLRMGKRLRASFVYYGYLLNNELVEEGVWKAMEAVELIHTALLMHDDFMDEDKLRRGKVTTQEYFAKGDKHYGESMAVNAGDVVLNLGYERLVECGLDSGRVNEAMRWMLRGITNTAYGQAFDMSLPKMGEVESEQVMALHKAKTAIYTYETPLMMGAILGGIKQEARSILSEYSMTGGVAFQIQDDVLGVFGESEITGKSSDSDLLQGKQTLLTTKLLEIGSEEQKRRLLKVWGRKKATSEDLRLAKEAIKDSGSYNFSVRKAKELAEASVKEAEKLRSLGLNGEAVDYLEGIARYLLQREV